jgi:hypothetical protein
MVYVPYYDPSQVYGQWWWPDYPPVYWAPWGGYRVRPGIGAGLLWGLGIRLGVDFFFGDFDWRERRVNVVNVNNFYRPRDALVANRGSYAWRHDPNHRRNVPYRAAAVRTDVSRVRAAPAGAVSANPRPARETAAPAAAASAAPEARRDFRGRQPAGPASRPTAATAPVVPEAAARPPVRAIAPAIAPVAAGRPVAVPPPHVLEGIGRGRDERDASARGRTSIQATVPAASAPVSRRAAEPVAAPRPREREAPRPAEKARDRKEGSPVNK